MGVMNKVNVSCLIVGLVVMGCTTTQSVPAETETTIGPIYEKSDLAAFDRSDTRNRTEFVGLLNRIRAGQSKEQVRDLLGEPDFINANDPNGNEFWRYGCTNEYELAVLGVVYFKGDVIPEGSWHRFRTLPPDLPEESLLREILRFMHRSRPDNWLYRDDPLHRVRVANRLIPLGKKKATATIYELTNLGIEFELDIWLFWLIQTLFDVPDTPGYMRPPALGSYGQRLQQKTRVPRYPTIECDDFSITIFAGASIRGTPEAVSDYLDEIGEQEMRTELFKPADDPFSSIENLWNSKRWPFPHEIGTDGTYMFTEAESKRLSLIQVLNLVRTVYRPSGELRPRSDEVTIMEYFERCSSEFSALGAVWNVEKQMYTLKDGAAPYPEIESVTRRWWARSID